MPEDPPVEETEEFDFGKKRKKKKDKEGGEKEENKKKKKDKESKEDKEDKDDDAADEEDGEAQVVEFVRGTVYAYEDLLHRIHEIIEDKNPALSSRKKYTMKPPEIVRVGSKKVGWTNFGQICTLMDRGVEHVMAYFSAEFGAEASLAGEGQLVVKGRFTGKQVETLLRKYISTYVTCAMCKSPQTKLERDPSTRLHNIKCESCGSFKSVPPIKAGFHATTRADRKRAKFGN
jgi:translation initiation factor 2 subunit 2